MVAAFSKFHGKISVDFFLNTENALKPTEKT